MTAFHARAPIYLCALLSGGAGLIYEVVWHRQLLLIFGSTTQASTAVLAAFLGGMALGAAIVGRQSWRIRRPFLAYAGLEALIALYALLLHRASGLLEAAAVAVGPSALMLAPLALGGAFLLLPTVAMGAALPLLALPIRRSAGRYGRHAGGLYGINTLGAALGAVGAGFVLLPRLGMTGTLATAVVGSLAAAAISILLAIRPGAAGDPPPRRLFHSMKAGAIGRRVPIAVAVLLAGVASLGYELVWTRILILIIGSSTYSFSLVLAVFVFGTALGSLWQSRSRSALRADPVILVHLQLAVAALALLSLFVHGRLPGLFLSAFGATSGPFGALPAQAMVAGLGLLPPALLIGAAFPLAVRILERTRSATDDGGRNEFAFAVVFALTAAGNVLGILLTGLVLIPAAGLQGAVQLLALINVAAALSVLAGSSKIRHRAVTAAAAGAGIGFVWLLNPRWDPIVMTSGVFTRAPLLRQLSGSEAGLERLLSLYRMRWYSEGEQSVVSVVEHPTLGRQPFLALAVDGKVDASTGKDMSTQVLSGHIPFIFHPDAQDVLVIGLASGVTAGSVATHPVRSITVVEIEPAIVAAARIFTPFNMGALDDPRLRLVLDDGRHYLASSREQYDVLISEPSNPWMSGPARLFTREFFELARSRLRPAGVLAQWVPLYGLGPEYFRSLLRTFLEVFPSVVAFQVAEADLLLIGSVEQLAPKLDRMAATFGSRDARADLARVDSAQAGALLSRWMGDEQTLRALARGAVTNTDNNGWVEFAAPHFLHRSTLEENLALLTASRPHLSLGHHLSLQPRCSGTGVTVLVDAAKGAIDRGQFAIAREVMSTLDRCGAHSASSYVRGLIMAVQNEKDAAREAFRQVAVGERYFTDSQLRLAALEMAAGAPQRVLDGILRRLPPSADGAELRRLRGLLALAVGDPATAVHQLEITQTEELSELTLEMSLLRFIAARRTGDPSLAERYRIRFNQDLARLRRAAERDESHPVVNGLLSMLSAQRFHWMRPEERRLAEMLVRIQVLEPLSRYYRGVSLLWTGRTQHAAGVLEEARAHLPEPDAGSMINYFLARAIEASAPARALGLLRSFAQARRMEGNYDGWISTEVERLISLLGAEAHGSADSRNPERPAGSPTELPTAVEVGRRSSRSAARYAGCHAPWTFQVHAVRCG